MCHRLIRNATNICQLTPNEHFPSLCHSSIHIYQHTRTCVHTKVCAAYHVFTDQLTLAGDRKPATKTETCGSQQRNQDCSLRAGNRKVRPLHIPVHLASRSTFKNENMRGSVRAGRASAVDDDVPGSTQATCPTDCCTCCFRLRPELTHRLEQRVLCVAKQLLPI